MSQRALICVVILFCLKIASVNAQVPVLDPSQTVNIATGAMGFTLPLGTVRGLNGHDFPINLSYHAGIRLHEDASPAGLGFGYEAGVITKSPVFANDESSGKPATDATNYDHQSGHNDHVRDYIRGNLIARIATAVVGVVLSFIPGTQGLAGMVIGFAYSFASDAIFEGVSGSPAGFVGGGGHMPQYQDIDKGIGFFKPGGTGDLPDNYYINCPYLNGKMVWVGDAQTGHFVMQSTKGSSAKNYETVKIKRNVDAQGFTTFEITLADGTRLFFEKYDAFPNTAWNFTYYEDYNPLLTPCTYDKVANKQSVPSVWHLTKVLFNDYTGSGNPLDPASNSKGSWLCFEYNSINQNNLVTPWQLKVGQGRSPGAGYGNLESVNYSRMGGHGTAIIMNYLERIISPLDTAIYNYSNNRKDFLFFRSDSNYAPQQMPKLDNIVIKNNQNKILRNVDFVQDYSLRPCTFSALKFSPAYVGMTIHTNNSLVHPFVVEPVDYAANPKCGALSLKQIVIKDGGSNKSYPIVLDYVNYPKSFAYRTTWQHWVPGNGRYTESYNGQPAQLFFYEQEGFTDCLINTIHRYFYQEKSDFWGYYLGETEYQNWTEEDNNQVHGPLYTDLYDWRDNAVFFRGSSPWWVNHIDDYTAAQPYRNPEKPWAANWSLNKISFPNGLSMEWIYEANQYHYANGQYVYSEGENGSNIGPLYGGGIRVKKVVYTNGNGKSENIRYIYNEAINGGTGTGYTPVIPYDYINDRAQPDVSRGGLYTCANVAYWKVIMAKNYQENATPHAPFGYTVHEFTHAGYNDASGFYPNEGTYGEIDYSWKRGLPIKSSSYNSSGKLISQEVSEYEFQLQTLSPLASYNVLLPLQNTTGFAKLKKTETTVNGVKSSSKQLFADDLTTSSVDNIGVFQKTFESFDNKANMSPTEGLHEATGRSRVVVCKTNTLGVSATDEDVAMVRTDGYVSEIKFYLCLGIDVKDGSTWVTNSPQQWSYWYEFTPQPVDGRVPFSQSYYVIGAQFFKMDTDDDDDLVVVVANGDESSSLFRELYIYVFHDIDIEAGSLQFNDNRRLDEINASLTVAYIPRVLEEERIRPVGCVIGNFHGTAKPDLLIINNSEDTVVYQGDLTRNGKRSISAIIDFEERHPDGYAYTPTTYQMAKSDWLPFTGCNGVIKAVDLVNNKFDLVISGPGLRGPAGYNVARPITYQTFKDVTLNDANHTITWSCENCTSNYELFTIQPHCGWDKFIYGGVSQEDATGLMQFIFPEWSANTNNGYHFNILNYFPIRGDYDGIPNRSYTQNSDGTILLSTNIPAYTQEKFKEMGYPSTLNNKHMLVQPCGRVTYIFPGTTTESVLKGDLSGHVNRVVGATASTWTNVNGAWLPSANYAWKVPMDSTGLPVTSYTPFNYTTPAASDTTWKLTDSICKYTMYTSTNFPKEIAKPTSKGGRLKTSIVYGHKGSITTGKIVNATFEECGVFTCDYDLNENNYFDKENSWEKGIGTDPNNPKPDPSVEISSENMFGTKSVRVNNSWGPTRNCRLSKGKNYIMTAWVKVESGKAWMAADYRYKTKTTDNVWPVTGLTRDESAGLQGKELGPTNCKWELMKLEIPAATVLKSKDWENYNWYARAYVGSVIGGTVYVQDIRISPKDAMVTSTYYDQKWFQPILSVDANNNPGQKVVYDDFGRPIRWYKINKNNPSNVTLLQEKEYHLMGLPNTPPEVPTGLSVTVNYPQLTFKWNGGDFDDDQTIIYKINCNTIPSGRIPITIGSFSAPASQKTFEETFTPTNLPDGDYVWGISATDGVNTVECNDGEPVIIYRDY